MPSARAGRRKDRREEGGVSVNSEAPGARVPEWLRAGVADLEHDPRLDGPVRCLDTLVAPVRTGAAGDVLRGEWLGHALHPLLTDFPLGCWIGAGLLDLVGGRRSRPAAQRLVGLGLLAVPATAAAGAADWSASEDPRARRVGTVHAVGNAVGSLCYLRSWRHRRAGRQARGIAWGMAGGGFGWVTGYLGGHLTLVLGTGHGPRGGLGDRGRAGRAPVRGAPSAWAGSDGPSGN
jgi:uncharacterized membrane protein